MRGGFGSNLAQRVPVRSRRSGLVAMSDDRRRATIPGHRIDRQVSGATEPVLSLCDL